MRAVDTNILARLLLNDDAAQRDAAETILAEPLWIGATVWLELGWVLSKRLERDAVADALTAILAIETVHCFDAEGLGWAIERYREGADWADVVHIASARGIADRFATFDKGIARRAARLAPILIETLA